MHKKKPIKAIVWDLDGTLIHFKIDYLRARKRAIEILKKNGVPKQYLTVKFSILENIKYAREFFEKEGFHKNRINRIIEEVNCEITKIEYEAAADAVMINGINEVLEFAKKNNLKQAIFTFNTRYNAEFSLKKVRLLHYFELIVGRDNIANLKPHPDHLTYICKQLNVKTDEILVIGDNIRDIEAALNVGAFSIATHTKFAKVENLQRADKIIKENEIPKKLIDEIKKLL
ncbi:MAG: HAD family hydrolase [Candidatus Odinarchaeota archaeon]